MLKRIMAMMMAMVMMFICTGCAEERIKPEDVVSYQSTIFVEYMHPDTKSYYSWGEMYDGEIGEGLTWHEWSWDFAYAIVERANDYVEEDDPARDYYITILVPDDETKTLMESVAHSTHINIEIDEHSKIYHEM